jgi:hypothetical protein
MDELGRFRVIGYKEENGRMTIEEIVEFSMNQTYTKRFLSKFKNKFSNAGLKVVVEEVHRPIDGWSYC